MKNQNTTPEPTAPENPDANSRSHPSPGSQPFHTGHSCEVCGGSMVIEDNADGLIYDDQECWCDLCGFESRTVVDEQGQTGIQMGVFDSENND